MLGEFERKTQTKKKEAMGAATTAAACWWRGILFWGEDKNRICSRVTSYSNLFWLPNNFIFLCDVPVVKLKCSTFL